jgi:hypothetical protein
MDDETSLDEVHDAYIATLRATLEDNVGAALTSARKALANVHELASDGVYDVEYAEGGEVQRQVELAASVLAGAQALAWRLHS